MHWRPWGEAALAEARATGKPILLSVGYAACHWCHVMAHESFEDEATAAVMNDLFVNIKVDREERPDVDAIYMGALHELGEQGGWPLTMFLTSDAEPFWGGTYFPKDERYGRPAFVRVLNEVARIYRDEQDKVRQNADVLKDRLKPAAARRRRRAAERGDARRSRRGVWCRRSIRSMAGSAARRNFRNRSSSDSCGAPVFATASPIRSRRSTSRSLTSPKAASTIISAAASRATASTSAGSCRISRRCSTTTRSSSSMMTEAWRETKSPLYAQRIEETVDWLLREMIVGRRAASPRRSMPTAKARRGSSMSGSLAEIEEVLGADGRGALRRDLRRDGAREFRGPQHSQSAQRDRAARRGDRARLAAMREKLLARRASRIRPGFDDKVLADWNGLMIAALANAAEAFDRPDWLAAAERAFDFVSTRMISNGRLLHAYRAGEAKAPATANDYANMIRAALALANVTGKRDYIERAREWADVLDRHYWANDLGGYYFVADDTGGSHRAAVQRTGRGDAERQRRDGVESDGALSMDRRGALSRPRRGDPERLRRRIAENIFAHAGLLAATLDVAAPALIVLIVPEGGDAKALRRALSDVSLPNAVVQEVREGESGASALPASSPAHGKTAIDGKPTAYVCIGPQCSLPVTEPARWSRP